MKEIEELRKEVDKADDELVAAFIKRLSVTDKIGEVKDGVPGNHCGRSYRADLWVPYGASSGSEPEWPHLLGLPLRLRKALQCHRP